MMKSLLVGSTGFVGSNLLNQHDFMYSCHSTDITKYYGLYPDLCVYAGIPSAMFLSEKNPKADLKIMEDALYNLKFIKPKKLILISTIMVYADSRGKTEDDVPTKEGLKSYGLNRLMLEEEAREAFDDMLIVRLPALYGVGLKKNFLYDLHILTPKYLTGDKYEQEASKSILVKNSYAMNSRGYYEVKSEADAVELKNYFRDSDFNALSFTDSRSKYQFYNLSNLWQDIYKAIKNDLNVLNIATPPVSVEKVYEAVTGESGWINFLENSFQNQDVRTCHTDIYGSGDGYFCKVEEEINDIVDFMRTWR